MVVHTETLWADVRHGKENGLVIAWFSERTVVDADLSSYLLLVGVCQWRVQTVLATTINVIYIRVGKTTYVSMLNFYWFNLIDVWA